VCGGPNECTAATSGSFTTPCWCTKIAVSPELLARLPQDTRKRSCLCRKCLAGVVPLPGQP
jgi:Cysteine-rich CWC